MRLNESQIQELIYHLQGTCMGLYEAVYQCFEVDDLSEFENELQICDALDNALFNCSKCGWWYEAGDWVDQGDEYSGEEICSQCGPEYGFGEEE